MKSSFSVLLGSIDAEKSFPWLTDNNAAKRRLPNEAGLLLIEDDPKRKIRGSKAQTAQHADAYTR